MNKKTFLLSLSVFILLCPLLHGFLGRLFSPLFYLGLIVFVWLGTRLPRQKPDIPFEKYIRRLFYALLVFTVLQVVPLPMFLLKVVSRSTVTVLGILKDQPPAFHPVSLVPFETLKNLLQLIVLALFFRMAVSVEWKKKELVSLFTVTVVSGIVLIPVFAGGFLLPGTRYAAFYLAMVFPLAPALLLLKLRYLESSRGLVEKFLSRVFRRKSVLGYLLATFALAGGILLIRSRPALLTFFLSCLLFFMWVYYFKRPRTTRRRLRKAFLVVAVLAVAIGLQSTVMHIAQSGNAGAPESKRWKQTISMIKAFPLAGAGFGTWETANFLYDPMNEVRWTPDANNGGLEILAEGGVVGAGLLALTILLIGIAIFKKWRNRRHPQVKVLGLGVLVSLFAATFHTVFNASLRVPSNLLVFVLLLALGIKIVNHKRPRRGASKGGATPLMAMDLKNEDDK